MTEKNYEFRVQGWISAPVRDAVGEFGDVCVLRAPPETLIYGEISDQAHLTGMLALLGNLGLRIVSVHQVPNPPA
ncbi:hypothetical protein FPZ12_041475 [Amycolatopsis acidicola]|uniref:Uncharacterized protein n=1 Tax=Amycolatopsis acidicola TaxID=2596893 RepID=A0A5N0UP53_9PSEU|nr:hypothetical protein [Amycolatopsis acidicola]KAA9150315.1 hypothetical protein FPZ12_041475 [Amycolatopsis acidicola]